MLALPRATSWLLRRSQFSTISAAWAAPARYCEHGVGAINLANRLISAQFIGGARFHGYTAEGSKAADSSQRNIFERVKELVGGYVSFSTPKVPKGFESFMPKGKPSEPAKPQEPEASSGSSSEKSSESNKESKTGGGGGGKGGPTPGGSKIPPNWQMHLAFAVLVASALMLTMQPSQGREINMQEFMSIVLESGKVEHLQVVNNRIVKVYLQGGGYASQGNSDIEAALGRGRTQQVASIPFHADAAPYPAA
jgi:hypothetical protein